MADINKLFLIDNDQVYQFTLCKCIELNHREVSLQVFQNGLDAITELNNHRRDAADLPDVILLDLKMPMLDGWGFLSEYNKFYHKLAKKPQLHLMTSSINQDDRSRALELDGVNSFLEKPRSFTELEDILVGIGVLDPRH